MTKTNLLYCISIVALLISCRPTTPSAPAPNLDATVQARVEMTQSAVPTATMAPTETETSATRTPTSTAKPTTTPQGAPTKIKSYTGVVYTITYGASTKQSVSSGNASDYQGVVIYTTDGQWWIFTPAGNNSQKWFIAEFVAAFESCTINGTGLAHIRYDKCNVHHGYGDSFGTGGLQVMNNWQFVWNTDQTAIWPIQGKVTPTATP